MRARTSLGWVLLPALLCASPAVHAGSADAEAAFREGRKAVQAGDWATACARFAESERLEPAPGTLLNLADCEDHLGRLVSAHEHFGVAASGFPRGDSRRSIALAREAQIDKRIVRLTLRLAPSAPPEAVVHKGDAIVPASSLGSPMLVDPGDVTLVVVAPGRVDRPYTLRLHDGDQVEQTLEAGDVAAAPVAAPAGAPVTPPPDVAPAPTPTSGGGLRTLGFVLGGVGVAGLATGAVTGLLALDRASTVKTHCPNLACDPQGLSAASQGQWLAPTSTVAFVAGGVLVAAGTYFVFFGGSRIASTVAVAPAIGPQSGGAVLHGAF
ncbi:MAG: hypothetical protein ABSE49_24285 [Polyangiaceae bacterium]|jgi:hypothetical protein